MYIDGFDGKEDIVSSFQAPSDMLDNAFILYAKYKRDGYEGSAYILYQIGEKLFEVHGGHCSCNGLEGQWEPEEVTFRELEFRWFQKNDMPYACEDDDDTFALRQIVAGEMVERIVLN